MRRAGSTRRRGRRAGDQRRRLCSSCGVDNVTGLSAVLLTSSIAFSAVKWIGAAYLVYLGVRALRGREQAFAVTAEGLRGKTLRAIFWQGFVSDALNPKVAVFYLAFLPQFVDEKAGGTVWQLLLLGLTVNMVAIIVNLAIVAASAQITSGFRGNPRIARRLQRGMGVIFIGLGARLAAETR
ncbi:MAG: LysE family translocator [Hyphomicrobiales bacterium]|nr:LysE family translocator [Hyphomicrobiales bacterium]MCC2107261.1 LysE family translocator [Hyphomicrobiales bacterium]